MARGDTITSQNRRTGDPFLDWMAVGRQPYPGRSVGCNSVLSPTGSILERRWCDYRFWMECLRLSWRHVESVPDRPIDWGCGRIVKGRRVSGRGRDGQ
jgi:hypothetical protein